jgi:hypothetical protein
VRTVLRSSGSIHKRQLEAWLVGTYERPITAPTMETLLDVDAETVPAVRRRSMRFVLAVLRDMFRDDRDVRGWLQEARPELGGASAADMLLKGSTEAVESCVVREWNQSTTRVMR